MTAVALIWSLAVLAGAPIPADISADTDIRGGAWDDYLAPDGWPPERAWPREMESSVATPWPAAPSPAVRLDMAAEHALCLDDFAGPDGSSAAGWTQDTGSWSLQDNQYLQSSPSGTTRSWRLVGPPSTLTVQANMRVVSGSAARIYWSRADQGQHYVEWAVDLQRIRIVEAGALRRNIEFLMHRNEPYQCRVEVHSGWLYVYVDDHLWLDVPISSAPDGRVGLGTRGATVAFDDFQVLDALFYDERPVFRLPYQGGTSLVGSLAPRMYTWTTHRHQALDLGGPDHWWAWHVPVVAMAPGVVTRAEHAEIGNTITVLHENGYETHYGHFDEMLVSPGDQVTYGSVIGLMGHTGLASFDHVHMQLHRYGEAIRPEPMSGYRTFCHYEIEDGGCGEWYTSDNHVGAPSRSGVVVMPAAGGGDGELWWRDDFGDWVIDQKESAPAWTFLDTQQHVTVGPSAIAGTVWFSGDLCERDGWLRMSARGDWGKPSVAWLRTQNEYQNCSILAKLSFADATALCGESNTELRFREWDDGGDIDGGGLGYSLTFNALGNIISLRRVGFWTLIDGRQISYPIDAGDEFYVSVVCDDSQPENLHICVGTTLGGNEIVDWRVNNREYGSGCIRLVNYCAAETAWDWVAVGGVEYDPRGDIVETADPGPYGRGWNLVSVPIEPRDRDAGAVFQDLADVGNRIADNLYRYQPGVGYEQYPLAFAQVGRGRGYWIWLDNADETAMAAVDGEIAGTDVSLALGTGWNLIGHPFPQPVPLATCRVTDGASNLSLDDAAAAGWITSTLYYWEPGIGYQVSSSAGYGSDHLLRPWRGYWIAATVAGLRFLVPRRA